MTPTERQDHHVMLLRERFSGRRDVYGTFNLATGRAYQCKQTVNDRVLRRHIDGVQPYGVYLLVQERTCATVVDVDRPDLQVAVDFLAGARQYDLPVYVERSKSKGHHIWMFHPSAGVTAAKSRRVVRHILDEIREPSLEVFPKHDRLGAHTPFGNFILAPLFGGLVRQGRTVFLHPRDLATPYEDQWEFLARVELVRESQLDETIALNELGDACPNAGRSAPSAPLKRTVGLPLCAQRMLSEGVRQHQRVSCFRLAVALKLTGLPMDATLAVLRSWACRIRPLDGKRIITPLEIEEQTSWAYRPEYRSFGCEEAAVQPHCDPRCRVRSRAATLQDAPPAIHERDHTDPPTRSTTMATSITNRPVQEFRARNLSLAIWQNEGTRDGRPVTLHSVTLNKRYQDQQTGEWKDSNSFFPDDLPRLRLLLDKAYEHLLLRDASAERSENGADAPAA
ncbi:MAG: hypothetical protein ABIG44_17610 [Planctomycetota bacterium]